jgi:fructokinase
VYPDKRLNVDFPEIQQDDIVLFGSFYAITPEVRKKLLQFIKHAKKKKAIIIYDPNFRKQHLHELSKLKPMIMENMSLADIVRGSNEDFSFIFGVHNADEAWNYVKEYAPNLLYTSSRSGVYVRTQTVSETFPVEKIDDPKSTIGAGDSFNAGVVYSLFKDGISNKKLNTLAANEWKSIVAIAVNFASHVCCRYDNYISKDFANEYQYGK